MANFSSAMIIIDSLLKRFQSNGVKTSMAKNTFNLCPLSRSALFMAAGRAMESKKDEKERAFYDPYAHLFADAMAQKYLNKMSKYAVNYVKHRTLYFDDHLVKIIQQSHTQKIDIIFLGIGLDTRSYRMDIIKENPHITVFELDLMDVIEHRRNVLIHQNHADKDCKAKIISICADFRNNEWMDELIKKGFNKNHCNIWIAEGLFPWLKKREINALFENIAKNAFIKGNHWMIGTFLNKNTMLQSKLNKLNKQNGDVTCKTGYQFPHLLLEQYGYTEYEIKPIGSLKKTIKTYQDYLEAVHAHAKSQNHLKSDHFAKSFMFVASK